MRTVRGILYVIAGLFIIGCLVILIYSSIDREPSENPNGSLHSESTSSTIIGKIENAVSSADDKLAEAKDDLKQAVDDYAEKKDAEKNNTTGANVTYAEIVKQQQQMDDESYRKALGITTSASTTTSEEGKKNPPVYLYAVNKNDGKVHKIDCMLLPGKNYLLYYESLEDAAKDGYTDKCNVCNP